MASTNSFPRIDSCIALYIEAWALFDEQWFTSAELSHRTVDQGRDTSTITGTNEPADHLDLLVAYGLLRRDEEGRYRVHCTPAESAEEWGRKRRPQLETLRERVTNQQEQRTSETERNDGRTDLLRHEGAVYVSIDIEEGDPFRAVVEDVTGQLNGSYNASGIALCCPAAQAGEVQQFADRLCDSASTSGSDVGEFEKVTSEVIGEHKDALEYRLYLRETE